MNKVKGRDLTTCSSACFPGVSLSSFVNLFCMSPCTDCPRKANRRLFSLVFKWPLTPHSNDMSVGQMRWLVPMKSINLSTYTRLSGVHLRLRKRTTCLIQFYLRDTIKPYRLIHLSRVVYLPSAGFVFNTGVHLSSTDWQSCESFCCCCCWNYLLTNFKISFIYAQFKIKRYKSPEGKHGLFSF